MSHIVPEASLVYFTWSVKRVAFKYSHWEGKSGINANLSQNLMNEYTTHVYNYY